ncbi:MAG: hypothetical protein M0000_02055 [Actinomycetota bacterium]|nr:hypothetical protein [Actinomycetota bacterium]MDA8208476.1 hypothetical protein [Actinomycetota bacterium]
MRSKISTKEKLIGFVVAIYSAAIFLGLWLPHINEKVAGGQNPLLIALEGVGIAALFAVTVAFGRRIYVGFAGLAIALGPWGKYVILGMPAVAYAAFVGFRFNFQPRSKDGKPVRRGEKAESTSARSSAAPSTSRRYTEPKKRKGRGKGKAAPAPTGTSFGSLGRLGPVGNSQSEKSGKK